MDQRIESFLADVLALAGEEPDGSAMRCASLSATTRRSSGCRTNKLLKDKAARACRVLCRDRVAEELKRRRGTRITEHLKLVSAFIDRQQER